MEPQGFHSELQQAYLEARRATKVHAMLAKKSPPLKTEKIGNFLEKQKDFMISS